MAIQIALGIVLAVIILRLLPAIIAGVALLSIVSIALALAATVLALLVFYPWAILSALAWLAGIAGYVYIFENRKQFEFWIHVDEVVVLLALCFVTFLAGAIVVGMFATTDSTKSVPLALQLISAVVFLLLFIACIFVSRVFARRSLLRRAESNVQSTRLVD